jgi:hypothetical protein
MKVIDSAEVSAPAGGSVRTNSPQGHDPVRPKFRFKRWIEVSRVGVTGVAATTSGSSVSACEHASINGYFRRHIRIET